MPRATLLKPIVLGTSISRPRGHCALDGQYIWPAPIKAEPSPIAYCTIKARISYVFQERLLPSKHPLADRRHRRPSCLFAPGNPLTIPFTTTLRHPLSLPLALAAVCAECPIVRTGYGQASGHQTRLVSSVNSNFSLQRKKHLFA